ncbi:two-component system regulatory protein YycI [Sporosarcina sp. G11-34]|uniref:two-component system regulatory protein YycI n=1 Tax=Sporosarcina sp. G11-34 TaxID=2849605 RepID=UPI0022A9EB28|nr:two-component system regulatory protein YycI [Sporosarcina sp. G11-34]MCZ2259058.1 two-component system regulatory protein YycI [Sporosarcina sp. G11-34]
MDWNKTKTIFIILFSILNVFLYSVYLKAHNETLNVQTLGKMSIEDSLKLDNIKVVELPDYNEDAYYVSSEVATITEEQISSLENQFVSLINDTELVVKMDKPVRIKDSKGNYNLREFLLKYVLNGEEYTLWNIDEDKEEALFFQMVNKSPIYFNRNAMLRIHWNESGEVTGYEQRMFGKFVSFNRKKDLLTPLQAINTLNNRNYLQPDSKVIEVSLGYSTLVQLTKNQVFAPTWRIRVELSDEEIEDYFVNAIEGKVIELQSEEKQEELKELEDDEEE